MSEADKQNTAVLLPASNVTVFSNDNETLEAANAIADDWRFARVNLQVLEGDVSTAIQTYAEVSSPDLVIIQTDKIDDGLTSHLEDLAGHCEEGTAAIVVGPDNDVGLYRKLIDMGVSDYLVKPIKSHFLAEVIAKTLIEKIGVTDSRLIAFVGAKGGVGASALAQSAAFAIADDCAQKTLFLDLAGGWSTASVGMGFEPSTTLAEAVKAAAENNEDNLKRMLHIASDKLSVLASGSDIMLEPSVNESQVEKLLDTLMVKYPAVVADLSHAPAELEKAILARAHQIVVVSTPTLAALRLARSLIQEVKEIRGGKDENIDLIINMSGIAPANEVSKKDIEQAMELHVSAIVPFLPKVFVGAESDSKKISDIKEGAGIVETIILPVIGKSISTEKTSDAPKAAAKDSVVGGFLKKLKTK